MSLSQQQQQMSLLQHHTTGSSGNHHISQVSNVSLMLLHNKNNKNYHSIDNNKIITSSSTDYYHDDDKSRNINNENNLIVSKENGLLTNIHPNPNHRRSQQQQQQHGSNVQLRPMGFLTPSEQRKRYRCILFMVLLCISIAITLLLWFWFLHFSPPIYDPYHRHHVKSPNNIYDSNSQIHTDMQQIANTALHNLNTNYMSDDTSNDIPDLCETTLLVFRHCDKLDLDDEDDTDKGINSSKNNIQKKNRHCSDVGYDRAQYITTLFGNNNTTRWPIPHYLYALSAQRDRYQNYREYETLVPLSKQISIPIQNVTGIPAETFANDYYFPLLSSKQICNSITIISWKHHWIPALVNTLGCGPNNGCPIYYPTESFDQVWELKFIYHHHHPDHHKSGNDAAEDDDDDDDDAHRSNGRIRTNNNDDDDNDDENHAVHLTSTSTFHPLRKQKHQKKKKQQQHDHHHHNYYIDTDRHIPSDHHPFLVQNHSTTTLNNNNNNNHWIVFGTVTSQMFDPLQYSKQHLGKYSNP